MFGVMKWETANKRDILLTFCWIITNFPEAEAEEEVGGPGGELKEDSTSDSCLINRPSTGSFNKWDPQNTGNIYRKLASGQKCRGTPISPTTL